MDINTILLIVLLVVLLIFIFIENFKSTSDSPKKAIESLSKNYEYIKQSLSDQSTRSDRFMVDITKEITIVKETNKQVLDITKQIDDLDRILKNPQKKGIIGEKILEQILGNVLPPAAYKIQHKIENAGRADAVIFLSDGKFVAIDSKFPLETYKEYLESDDKNAPTKLQATIKNQIEETSKYIVPAEGSLDFALMFLPSESLYYELLTGKIGTVGREVDLIEYAFKKHKVIIVSPNTIFAYLMTVNLGMRSLEVEKNIKEVLKHIDSLKSHFSKYSHIFNKLGTHIKNTDSSYQETLREYNLIEKDLGRIKKD